MRIQEIFIVTFMLLASGCGSTGPIDDPVGSEDGESIEIVGKIEGSRDVSAIGVVGEFLVLGSDESSKVNVFRREGPRYRLLREIALDRPGTEIDIEGIATEGDLVYVIASHSRIRSRRRSRSPGAVVHDPARDRIFRFRLDSQGNPGPIETRTLRTILDSDPVLAPYCRLPGKENGVDVEGLAVRNGTLYVGFRGPVLPSGKVPVLMCTFDDPKQSARLVQVDLKGRGIRDLTRVESGFLILAGPGSSGRGSFQLYRWDGEDGSVKEPLSPSRGQVRWLIDLPDQPGKPEGIALTKETASEWELLVVRDGVVNGGPVRLRVAKQ